MVANPLPIWTRKLSDPRALRLRHGPEKIADRTAVSKLMSSNRNPFPKGIHTVDSDKATDAGKYHAADVHFVNSGRVRQNLPVVAPTPAASDI